MSALEEILLAPQFDGLVSVVKTLVSALTNDDEELRRKFAYAAAQDVRTRSEGVKSDASKNVMLLMVATACGVPITSLMN